MKEEILKLRGEGKTYLEIQNILHCSKSLISYYCNPDSKLTIKKGKIKRSKGIYKERVENNKICLNCNSEIKGSGIKYCSKKCSSKHKSTSTYEFYLKNQHLYSDRLYATPPLKQYILLEQNYKCSICKCENFHNNKDLIFVLDHIDGNAKNNLRENLRCVCPNCDSQLDTYKSKNKNSARSERYKQPISSIE